WCTAGGTDGCGLGSLEQASSERPLPITDQDSCVRNLSRPARNLSSSSVFKLVYTKVFNRTGPAVTLRNKKGRNEGILVWFPKLESACPALTLRTSTLFALRSTT